MSERKAIITRTTGETNISLELCIDGTGKADINTGIGFLDHMLITLARHGLFDITLHVEGDLHIDYHHTTEDTGIALGQAFAQAMKDKRGIKRFGSAIVPLDEALTEVVVDLSGRPYLAWNVRFPSEKIGLMDTELFEEFFRGFTMSALMNVHVTNKAGRNSHHIAETAFKACARALRMACEKDVRLAESIPSTKGVL